MKYPHNSCNDGPAGFEITTFWTGVTVQEPCSLQMTKADFVNSVTGNAAFLQIRKKTKTHENLKPSEVNSAVVHAKYKKN